MSNDELLWTHKPPARGRQQPTEPLWSVRQANVTWSCELRFHGESVGWEAQILRDGDLVIGRTFVLKEMAMRWAAQEREQVGVSR